MRLAHALKTAHSLCLKPTLTLCKNNGSFAQTMLRSAAGADFQNVQRAIP
jgi:hypothetical protein